MSIIALNAHLLAEASHEADKHESTDAILQATQQGKALIRQLLVRSEIVAGGAASSPLDATVQSVLAIIAPILPHGIVLRTDMGAPRTKVSVPPHAIQRMLNNLLLNASEAVSIGGHIAVTTFVGRVDPELAGRYPGLRPGAYGVVSVSDDGPGIPADLVARIFEPFTTTKSNAPSRGLGLASVFGLVKEAGGYVSVESAEREGSTFRIYLPVTREGPPCPVEPSSLAHGD